MIDMDHAATAVGRSLCLSEGRPRDGRARARALRAGEAARPRLRAGDPAGAGARACAVRNGLPARHRAADLPPGRRRPVSGRHLRGGARLAARRGDPRRPSACRCATRATRPASVARRGRPARTRAGSSACTSSTRSRCSASSSPSAPSEEHERILAIEEEILGELELPYRVVNIAVGDLGNSAAKKYDCEAWLPSQGRYRELTSCSNTTDYQARRLNIRVRARGAWHADAAHAQRHRGGCRSHDHRAA